MPTETATPLIITQREGAITRITLNRPRALNALNREMFVAIEAAVHAAVADGSAAILLDGAGDRGFCGGGDIKQLSSSDGREILAIEYRLDYLLATAPIPVIGFMDGISMGGGIGLAGHASHRVVTESSRLAMPEVRIGIAPDVGGHFLLARATGRLGELLAITAGEMNAGDAIALGFADYFVPAERLPALAEACAAGEDPGTACARFAEPAPESPRLEQVPEWEALAEAALGGEHPPASVDPVSAAVRLMRALEEDAPETAAVVRGMCPTSVAATLAQLDRTRRLNLSLAEVLEDDLRVVGRLSARPDFTEGVRAQVIDKDRNPKWQPARIEQLDAAEFATIVALELAPDEPPVGLL